MGGRAEAPDGSTAPSEGSGRFAHGPVVAGGAAGVSGIGAPRAHVLKAGAERLAATLDGCREFLPAGTRWTRPEGGMNIWVRLPEPMDAGELLPRAEREGVAYRPGRYFAVSRNEPGALRLSFAGLTPEEIRAGLAILGRVAKAELESS